MKRVICCLFICVSLGMNATAQLVTYGGGMTHNDDYTVRVRVPGGEWKDLFEYMVQVDMDDVQNSSMVQFDMGSTVEVMVKKNNGTIQDVAIRPFSKKIEYKQQANIITFQLNKPQYLSIEFNGDRLRNLHLFANPLETETYTKASQNVLYFGPGQHKPDDLPGIEFHIPSNTTVYLAPGAIVKAKLVVDRAENVRIIGRGIIDHPQRGIEVTHSKNVTIDGITVVNPDHYTVYGGQTKGLTVRNLKSFSCKGWSDGIDLMSCSDVLIDNVFMRNSDDCITVYGHRWDYYGDVNNVEVRNSVLWADVAHPINIGGHGNTEGDGEVIENLLFKNIDILEQDEDDRLYQGCMAFGVGDKNLVRNVTFDDIRVESIQEGQLFHMCVLFNSKYNTASGRGIENVLFKNITYNGYGENPSVIEGYDATNLVRNITFENVVINGKKVQSIKELGATVGGFVENIKFK